MADLKISQLTGATTPLAGTEVLPIVQSSTTKKIATDDLTVKNIRSNATTGILQVAGPAASTTRTMTTPNANFTAARTDAGQTFTGNQTIEAGSGFGSTEDVLYLKNLSGSTAISRLKFGTAALADSGAIGVYTQDASNGALIIWAKSGGTLTQVAYANSDLTFHVNSNNLVFDTAAKGINFTANTPAAGMTSQLLNWYEEGTWTPTLAFGGSSTGITYATQTGRYVRTGNMVHVSGRIDLSNKGSASGDAQINGLPYAALVAGAGSVGFQLSFGPSNKQIMLTIDNAALIVRYADGTSTSVSQASDFANNSICIFSATYRV